MKKPTEITELQESDEGYIENDMDMIIERLESDFISYIQIHTNRNFPLLFKRDILALRKNDHYKVNDIVLYEQNNFYFVRRIIAIGENKYYVCGDNEYDVRIIPQDCVIARGISRERGKKRLSLILMHKNKSYARAMAKKGKIRMKHHTIFDDETTLTNVYDQALTAHEEESLDTSKKSQIPEMAIDARLESLLSIFKSPEQRLMEFEESKKPKGEEENFEEESDD